MNRTRSIARKAAALVGVRRRGSRAAAKPVAAKPPTVSPPRPTEPDKWSRLTDSQLAGLETCDPIYRPTNFWGPGVSKLIDDMKERGLPAFKSWPTATFWFYPVYGNGYSNDTMKKTHQFVTTIHPRATKTFLTNALNGGLQARRDFDAVRISWDQERWPFDLNGFGESRVGIPPQRFRMTGETGEDAVGWGRPYLNYLLCLAALSHHVDKPPKSFIEIGGGFGVLGEIVKQRDPATRYVNLDIPPLLTVAAYYLTTLFGEDQVKTSADLPEHGPVTVSTSACLPNWRIMDVEDSFDVFLNSFSFQEMEPAVVEHYIDAIAKKNVKYIVSLNTKNGKPKAEGATEIGVIEQVKSAMIVKLFEDRGYKLRGRYREPLIVSAGEIVVLERV